MSDAAGSSVILTVSDHGTVCRGRYRLLLPWLPCLLWWCQWLRSGAAATLLQPWRLLLLLLCCCAAALAAACCTSLGSCQSRAKSHEALVL